MRVLIVDDDPDFVTLVQTLLGTEEFDVEYAYLVADALEMIENHKYDIVLLDLRLPNGEGVEVFNRIHAQIPHTPIVILSVVSDLDTAIKAVRAGAQDFIVKGSQLDRDRLTRATCYAVERFSREREDVSRTHREFSKRLREISEQVGGSVISGLREVRQHCVESTQIIGEMNATLKATTR
jgi:DNA-binding NtrC family response regulator